MKNQKGFIQIPLLIAIIAGVLVLGGGGYFGVRKYQSYQAKKTDQERIAQEKEKEVQAAAETQQKALGQAQAEIEKLKMQSVESKKKQEILEQKVQNEQKLQPQSISISATELEPYLLGVNQVVCYPDLGSGSLWKLPNFGGFVVLTNEHVVEGHDKCVVTFEDGSGETKGSYTINISEIKKWNKFTDVGVFGLNTKSGISVGNLNYKISELTKCPAKLPLGSPVVIIGYPAYGIKYVDLYNQGFKQYVSYRIVSNGIISGYDTSVEKPRGNLPYQNYFVSAKIDSGNSGGITFSKDSNGLCVLGIPTWLTVGNYETQGLVQNIHNVMYIK